MDIKIEGAIELCNNLIQSNRHDEALNFIVSAVVNTYQLPPYSENLFYSQLDDVLLHLSEDVYRDVKFRSPRDDLHVIVGSYFWITGGHSRVAKDMATHSANCVVVITDLPNQVSSSQSHFEIIAKFFHPTPVLVAPPGGLYAKIKEVAALIGALSPRTVSCLNHYWDPVSVAVTACAPVSRRIYHHHCDHNPSLGASIQSYYHLDTTEVNFQICRQYRPEGWCAKLPLYVEDVDRPTPPHTNQHPLNTISAGGRHKYLFDESSLSYPQIIVELIKHTGGLHHHYGKLDVSDLDLIHKILENNQIRRTSFCYHGDVESLAAAVCDIENPVYVPSFPVPGGLSLIEFMACGIPVMPLVNSEEQHLNVQQLIELLPSLSLSWETPEDINEALMKISINYQKYSIESRSTYENQYSKDAFLSVLKMAMGINDSHL